MLLDEFKTLGAFPFLSDTMGILASYGINFYIVVQALNQIVDLYGQQHTFMDNCKTVMVYAPGKIEDAKTFTDMIGKESVVNENLSISGSRYSVSLNNLNASNQEIARDLMNPDELMKLPPTEALILNQGMPAYIAKKCVYYEDKRFKKNAYSFQVLECNRIFGLPIKPDTAAKLKKTALAKFIATTERELTTGFKAPANRKELEHEFAGLPSQIEKRKKQLQENDAIEQANAATFPREADFDPLAYLEAYGEPEDIFPATCQIDSAIQAGQPGRQTSENHGLRETGEDREDDREQAPTIYEAMAISASFFDESEGNPDHAA
jgi:hypothetical protein